MEAPERVSRCVQDECAKCNDCVSDRAWGVQVCAQARLAHAMCTPRHGLEVVGNGLRGGGSEVGPEGDVRASARNGVHDLMLRSSINSVKGSSKSARPLAGLLAHPHSHSHADSRVCRTLILSLAYPQWHTKEILLQLGAPAERSQVLRRISWISDATLQLTRMGWTDPEST